MIAEETGSGWGLIGTVLGLLLLTIGLWRSAVGPRWVPAALAAFLVIEFVGTGITPWASAVGGASSRDVRAMLSIGSIWMPTRT